MLEDIDTACLEGHRVSSVQPWNVCFEQQLQKYEADDWHHPHYQMIWMEKHAVDDPKVKDHLLNVFSGPLVWR